MRWTTMTTATMRGGTERRPISEEEIGERLIRKEAVPFLMEDAVNRRLAQPFLAELAARTVEVFVCR